MTRLQLFELEDQSWFPSLIRDLATDYLHFVESRFDLHRPMVGVIAGELRETGVREVVDLCSGGGGPIPRLQRALQSEGLDIHFTLTDRFPNLSAFEHAQPTSPGRISFLVEPVDARKVPRSLQGLRTMFNAFHHFEPAAARAVLKDAARAGQPIAIFEIPERSAKVIVATFLLTPLFVLGVTPFIRPFSWRRLCFTYLLPLVPLTCWWDGVVSQLRAYTVAELEEMTEDPELAGYRWTVGQLPIGGTGGHITYLTGHSQ